MLGFWVFIVESPTYLLFHFLHIQKKGKKREKKIKISKILRKESHGIGIDKYPFEIYTIRCHLLGNITIGKTYFPN